MSVTHRFKFLLWPVRSSSRPLDSIVTGAHQAIHRVRYDPGLACGRPRTLAVSVFERPHWPTFGPPQEQAAPAGAASL